jgi:DNA-binding response OmpR family regulator
MAPVNILIADDEARMRKLVADFLKKKIITLLKPEMENRL